MERGAEFIGEKAYPDVRTIRSAALAFQVQIEIATISYP
jgi:hypothetical protein